MGLRVLPLSCWVGVPTCNVEVAYFASTRTTRYSSNVICRQNTFSNLVFFMCIQIKYLSENDFRRCLHSFISWDFISKATFKSFVRKWDRLGTLGHSITFVKFKFSIQYDKKI